MPKKRRQKRQYPGAVLPGAGAAGVQFKILKSEFIRYEALVMFFEAIDRVMLRAQNLPRPDAMAPMYDYPFEDRDSWLDRAHEHALTAAWFFSLDEENRWEAAEKQVVQDLYDNVFPHYNNLPEGSYQVQEDLLSEELNSEYGEAYGAWRKNHLNPWAERYQLHRWKTNDGKPSRPRSSSYSRFLISIEYLLRWWQRCDGGELSRKHQRGQKSRELARHAKVENLWGPFFRHVVDVPDLTRDTLMYQQDSIVDYVPWVGPLTAKAAPFRGSLHRAVVKPDTGPTSPYFTTLKSAPEIHAEDDLADWEDQLKRYADRVEKAARDVGIEEAEGRDTLLRDFEWLVRRTVYWESPGEIATAENLLRSGRDSHETVAKSIREAAKLIGLELPRGRPKKRK